MQSCIATVVLVFLSNLNFQLILQDLLGLHVMGQIWVSKDVLHMVIALMVLGISQILWGSFGLQHRINQATGFPGFLAHLHPSRTPEDMFIKGFWEANFRCTWSSRNITVVESIWLCTGNEGLTGHEYPFQEVSEVDVAYLAAYIITHNLHNLMACEHRGGMCADPQHFQPWQVREKHMTWVIQGKIDKRTLILAKIQGWSQDWVLQ